MYANNNQYLDIIQNENENENENYDNDEFIFNVYLNQLHHIRTIYNHRKYLFIPAIKRNTVLLFNEFILFQLNSNIFKNNNQLIQNFKSLTKIIIYTLFNRIYYKHLLITNTKKKLQIIKKKN